MAFSPASPVTGAPQTGFTSPTYTIVSDVGPDASNTKQYAVTAIGGTQAGVTTHSVSSPFTTNLYRPKQIRTLAASTSQLSVIRNVPKNVFGRITRKGVTVLAGQPIQVAYAKTTYEIPAGADTADASNVRAMLSLHEGIGWAQSSGIGDTLINAVL